MSATEFKHKTLSAYYHLIYTIHDFLLLNSPFPHSSKDLLHHDDPKEYRTLLTSTVCAFRSLPDFLKGKRKEGDPSARHMLSRTLEEIARRDGSKNVLFFRERVGGPFYTCRAVPLVARMLLRNIMQLTHALYRVRIRWKLRTDQINAPVQHSFDPSLGASFDLGMYPVNDTDADKVELEIKFFELY